MGLYYDNMCSGTDFTREKSNFQPTTEFPNSYSYSLTLKYPFFCDSRFAVEEGDLMVTPEDRR